MEIPGLETPGNGEPLGKASPRFLQHPHPWVQCSCLLSFSWQAWQSCVAWPSLPPLLPTHAIAGVALVAVLPALPVC